MKNWFKIFLVISLAAILLAAIGCSSSSTSSARGNGAVPSVKTGISSGMAPMVAPAPDMYNQSSELGEKGYAGDSATDTVDRKIIRTGYITMVVDKVDDAISKISAMAVDMGGYVVNSNKNDTDAGVTGMINIRIPANKYEDAFNSLHTIAVKVPSESTNSQDVTEEYVDLQARLKTQQAAEAQYMEILEKAQTVEDILKVQNALANVRQQIEQLKGRIQYLDRTTDMSLIQVSLQESKTFQDKGWNAFETLKSAALGLIEFGKVLLNILIWLLIFCPVWIIVIVVIVLVRRHKRKKAKAA
jgi:hypothetical protein